MVHRFHVFFPDIESAKVKPAVLSIKECLEGDERGCVRMRVDVACWLDEAIVKQLDIIKTLELSPPRCLLVTSMSGWGEHN